MSLSSIEGVNKVEYECFEQCYSGIIKNKPRLPQNKSWCIENSGWGGRLRGRREGGRAVKRKEGG
jgi:hypothetical protein